MQYSILQTWLNWSHAMVFATYSTSFFKLRRNCHNTRLLLSKNILSLWKHRGRPESKVWNLAPTFGYIINNDRIKGQGTITLTIDTDTTETDWKWWTAHRCVWQGSRLLLTTGVTWWAIPMDCWSRSLHEVSQTYYTTRRMDLDVKSDIL